MKDLVERMRKWIREDEKSNKKIWEEINKLENNKKLDKYEKEDLIKYRNELIRTEERADITRIILQEILEIYPTL